MDKLIRPDQEPNVRGQLVRLRKGDEKPHGVHLLTDNEVLSLQMKTITKWKPRYQMWPFTWGVGILGGTAAVSGIYVNNYLRRQLGLMHLARLGTYAPTVILPVVLATTFHKFLITDRILVGDFPCTVCAGVQSGSIQAAAGVLYPLILGPLVCVASARKYYTYYVPGLSERAAMLPFLRRILPKSGILLGITLLNFGIAMAITERETMLFAKYLSPSTSTLEIKQEDEFYQ